MIKLIAAAATVGCLAFAIAGPAQAYQCKNHSISAVGVKDTRFQARATSLANWTTRTKDRHGLAWSVYKIAENKSVQCRRTTIAGQRKWNCQRVATPCLYVVQ